jgi:hypothetical protein
MGSFRPDSSSRAALTRFGTATRAKRNIVFTAVASVGARTAPTRSASVQEIESSQTAVAPTIPAVRATPKVASARDGPQASRIMARSIFNPPSNRMIAKAILPIR